MRIRDLLLGSACTLGLLSPAYADEPAKPGAPATTVAPAPAEAAKNSKVEKVTITATRQKRKVDEVPATVSVITSEEIDDNLAADVKDLIRFEPGVSVRAQPSRFQAVLASTGRDGNSSFNIRGLEGNRVLIQIDGVRVPDGFSFGPLAVGRGDYLDLEVLKSVEILRGPASALYGSDGVAGAVSFITKDPDDFLDEGETFGGRVRAAYSSADEGWAEGIVAATQTKSGEWQGLLAYTRRDLHETDNQGDVGGTGVSRTEPNPTTIASNSVFAKLLFVPSDSNRFRLTYEYYDRQGETDALTARGVISPSPFNILQVLGEDSTTRNRVVFDHRYAGDGFISSAAWAVYYQKAETSEFGFEDRPAPTVDRSREGLFDNTVWGGNIELQTDFSLGGIANSLIYGGDYSVTRQEGLRKGDPQPAPPDFFPQQPFPDTDFTYFGAFIQDEISFMDGRLKFYPALRFDSFEIEPEASPLFPLAMAGQKDDHLTPKFGATFWPTDHFGLFANYAQGFKAPAPSQVNTAFFNAQQDYTSAPNPNLKPETSETFEGGVRVRDIDFLGGLLAASATGFTGSYDDFIDQVVVSGDPIPTPGGATTVFQYVNIGSVEIQGFEARVDSTWQSGLGMTLAFSMAEGDQTVGGVTSPLATIDPWKLVGGLRYDDPEGIFGGQLFVTHSSGKDAGDVNAAALCVTACFMPDGFTILDMTAYWNVTDRATLRVGVFNVFDETYIWWSDVRGLPISQAGISDAYSQPGRNVSVSLTYRF